MTEKIRAAQYVRMSTEHQQYSTENQADVIRDYAEKHDMEIVRTFADAGKSGLRIQGRDALQELLDLARAGKADFSDDPRLRREPVGAVSGRRTKARSTNTRARAWASPSSTAPSSSRTTGR